MRNGAEGALYHPLDKPGTLNGSKHAPSPPDVPLPTATTVVASVIFSLSRFDSFFILLDR
jgi:hypothetical protein